MNYEEKLREIVNSKNTPFADIKILSKYFPELRESENEKIRKGLIKGLSAMRDIHKHQTFSDDAINIDDAIAWLEKQGEKPVSTEETELNSLAFLTELGYTCIPPEKEQQPEDWSEEDEEYYMIVKESILERWKGTDNKNLIEIRDGVLNWLKSLKHSWKPTKEQMYILNWVANTLLSNDGIVERETAKILNGLYNDLKSL